MHAVPRFREGSVGVIFQGQNGNHFLMGRDLYNRYEVVQDLFRTASGIVGRDMRDICFGSLTHLQKEPRYVQPAIVTVELAEYRVFLECAEREPDAVTGLSLGMYAALAASRATSEETAIHISNERGQIVDKNAKDHPGAMALIKGFAEQAHVDELFSKFSKISEGVHWGTYKLVTITGAEDEVAKAMAWSTEKGAQVVPSKVREAAHHILQELTKEPLWLVMENAEIVPPAIDLLSNDPKDNDTAYLDSKEAIMKHLTDQMIELADMDAVNERIALDGIDNIVEFGPSLDKEGKRDHALALGVIRKSRSKEFAFQRAQMGRLPIQRPKYEFQEAA